MATTPETPDYLRIADTTFRDVEQSLKEVGLLNQSLAAVMRTLRVAACSAFLSAARYLALAVPSSA